MIISRCFNDKVKIQFEISTCKKRAKCPNLGYGAVRKYCFISLAQAISILET